MSKGEQTRQEILERALALAGEVGLEGLSLGVLAAGMNLSKSGLFAHFKSKEALQVEVLQRAIDQVCTVGRTLKSGAKVTFEVSDAGVS